ncbi:hypothetical protein [Sulfobacillus thermosulfidooxidans]|uniref:hypothetical protein n=1 Tax=Sulfobacillus thermosulfidooxidans TaxID=28034 RepID=UPI0006B5E378|nr:hypothetical protein [Sulfobacillus thermosulfidooxidans]
MRGTSGKILSAITSAVSQGIQGGFNGLDHTVNMWLFALPATLWLAMQFGMQWGIMLQDLAAWLQLSGSSSRTLMALAKTSPHATLAYSLWTPGAVGSAVPITLGWSPAWAVLVGMIWVLGVLGGIARLMAGRKPLTLTTLGMPFLTGGILFVTPRAVPWMVTQWWHLVSVRSLIPAIGHMIGLSASASTQWLTNPFWLWGALWGLSGTHGFAYLDKAPLLLGFPVTVAVMGGIAHSLATLTGVAGGNLSLLGAVGSWLYGVFHIGVTLTVALTTIQALWTLMLLLGTLWLGLSPLWVWVIALDPWSMDTTRRMAGLTLRVLALQAATWVWVTVIVALDGGSHHGPLGTPVALTGLTPWLSGLVTGVGLVAGWRWVLVPLRLWGREMEISVVAWWSEWQHHVADVSAGVGQILSRSATWSPASMGSRMARTGERLTAWGEQRHERADAWLSTRGWTATDQAQAQGAQWGSTTRPEWNPLPTISPDQVGGGGVQDGWRVGEIPHVWEHTTSSPEDARKTMQTLAQNLEATARREAAMEQAWQEATAQQVPLSQQSAWVTRRVDRLLREWQQNPQNAPVDQVPLVWTEGADVRVATAPPADYQVWWERAAEDTASQVTRQDGESDAAWGQRRVAAARQRLQEWLSGTRPWPEDVPRPTAIPSSWQTVLREHTGSNSSTPQRTRQGLREAYRQGVWTVDRWFGGDASSEPPASSLTPPHDPTTSSRRGSHGGS